MKYPKILASSANSDNLSLTIKGLLLGLLPLAIFLSDSFGWGITQNQASEFISVVTQLIAGAIVIYGLIRKIELSSIKK